MMDDLPTDYDVIVVGTGMTESVIAAALSRIGKSVLHVDSNEYYGENWASFNLEGFKNWIKSNGNPDSTGKTSDGGFDGFLSENEKVVKINPELNIWNAQLTDHSDIQKTDKHYGNIKEEEEESEKEIRNKELEIENKTECLKGSQGEIQKLSRKFNLDLCPKLLFSKGILVQLLITSNIARYAEFKSISRVLTFREGQLEPVPCSRADVFATKNVTVVHKRILVKILTLFANYTEHLDEFKNFEKKTFLEYLKHKKLPDNLLHYILYAIAMGDNNTSCIEGVKNCKAFLESLGRYGNTPFIFPMYGSGELPQCFCRLCAVFGGVYCLQRGIDYLIIKDDKCVGVISKKKRLNAKAVVLSSKYAPKDYLASENGENISRGIFITDRSILPGDKESLTLLQFPPIPKISNNSVTVLELGSGTCVSPENYFVVHMTSKMTKEASLDLKHVVSSLFATETVDEKGTKPKILWSSTWNVAKGSSKTTSLCPNNVKICCSVDSELDYDFSIKEAKKIFEELHPKEEFLPRAPDPDEIVLDGEERASESTDEKSNGKGDLGVNNANKSEGSKEVKHKPSVIDGDHGKDNLEEQTCDERNSNEGNNHSPDS